VVFLIGAEFFQDFVFEGSACCEEVAELYRYGYAGELLGKGD
jgi:hypothetical protein